MKVAGEVADGALLMTGIHPGAVSEAREIIADGARAAGRNPDDVETIFTATTIIKDRPQGGPRDRPPPGCLPPDGRHVPALAEGRRYRRR